MYKRRQKNRYINKKRGTNTFEDGPYISKYDKEREMNADVMWNAELSLVSLKETGELDQVITLTYGYEQKDQILTPLEIRIKNPSSYQTQLFEQHNKKITKK